MGKLSRACYRMMVSTIIISCDEEETAVAAWKIIYWFCTLKSIEPGELDRALIFPASKHHIRTTTMNPKIAAIALFRSNLFTPVLGHYLRFLTNLNMSTGDKKGCIPCSGMDESHLLPTTDLHKVVEERLPLWELSADFKFISRTFIARNFPAALDTINSMGVIAEEQSHHPDFHLTDYRQLRIVVATHKLDGITENDLVLAELLDEVPIDYSPKWLRENPAAQKAKSSTQE
eukprot:scaffold21176_cov153-Amphora_coffeaeformis.AAC.1